LLLKVSVHHEQQESGIEELDDEDSVRDQAGLLRQSIIANTYDKLDDDSTKDNIDNDDGKLGNLIVDLDTKLITEVLVTD
jgi:hypothetical protein